MATDAHPTTTPARVVVLDARPAGGRDRNGDAVFALDVTVLCDERTPFRSRLAVAVPDGALALVHPGAELPAVLVGEGELAVPVIDLTTAAGDPVPSGGDTTHGEDPR